MFWLRRNRFSGSYSRLRDWSRAYRSAPYKALIRSEPSSFRKLTYVPLACGMNSSHDRRTQVRCSSNPSGPSVAPTMLTTCPEERSPKAVASAGTRETAPPAWKMMYDEYVPLSDVPADTAASTTSSVSESTSVDRV